MQISTNITAYEAINNFKSFCHFVAQRYDIQILTMDSFTGAATKNVIYVPNFEGMNTEQIEFVFSTVLHEIGHIKFTDFSDSYFSKLLNTYMATIANVLEDCRSENLLCKEFSGAKDIFLKSTIQIIENNPVIYTLMTQNNEEKETDFFHSFTQWLYVYAHPALYSSELEEIVWQNMPENIRQEVQDFLKKTNFIKKWSNLRNNIHSQNDVLKFSQQIHNQLVKVFPQEDRAYFSFEDFRNLKKIAQETTIELNNKLENLQIKEQEHNINIFNLEIEAQTVKNKILEKNKDNENLILTESKILSAKKALIAKASKLICVSSNINSIKENSQDSDSIISEKEEKNYEITDKKNEMKTQWKKLSVELLSIESNTKNEKKIARINKKIEKIKEKIEKMETRQEKINTSIDKVSEKMERQKIYAEKSKSQQKNLIKEMSFLKGKPTEYIKEYIDKINKEVETFEQKMTKLNDIKNLYMTPYDSLVGDIFFKKIIFNANIHHFRKEMTQKFKSLNSQFIKLGMNFSMFPRISLSIEWKEMAREQILADEAFMKNNDEFVIDGNAFGETTSELESILDMVKNNLQSLDPVLEYKKQFSPCLKEKLLAMQVIETWIANDSDTSNVIAIKHAVDSTEFDEVIQSSKVSTIKLQEMQMLFHKNSDKMDCITECLAHSLKPKKRDRWENNKESGDIDSEALSRFAINGHTNIFEESFSEIRENSGATILIDMSYSASNNELSSDSIKIMTQALSEALDACSISHEILGFYAKVEPNLFTNKPNFTKNRRIHGLKTVVFKNIHSNNTDGLSNFKFQLADNSDGESLRVAVKRLESNGFDRKLVFLISDFLPFLTNSNTELLKKDFQKAINFAKKNQTNIYGFSVNKETAISQDFPFISIDGLSTKNTNNLDEDGMFDFLQSIR